MHVRKIDITLRTTRAVEFQRQNDRRVVALQQQPGFLGCLVLNSLGYPVMQMSPMYFQTTKFVVITQWESAQAADACFASEAWRAFAEEHPSEQLFTPQEPEEQYETLHQCGRAVDRAPFAWLVSFDGGGSAERASTLADTLADDAVRLCELYGEHLTPFIEGRVLQAAGSPGRVLAVLLMTGQSEFPPGRDVPALQPFLDEHVPETAIGERIIPEGFQVVHLLSPA